jgi:hypothetical protein
LASGTTNREHGVFFRLRPSRSGSLEGAKEFMATVPRSWRGDLCTISCTARAKKSSLLSTSVAPAGEDRIAVGMYLAGDAEALTLAEDLRKAQDAKAAALSAPRPKENVFETISSQTVVLFTGKKTDAQSRKDLSAADAKVRELRNQLQQLAH